MIVPHHHFCPFRPSRRLKLRYTFWWPAMVTLHPCAGCQPAIGLQASSTSPTTSGVSRFSTGRIPPLILLRFLGRVLPTGPRLFGYNLRIVFQFGCCAMMC